MGRSRHREVNDTSSSRDSCTGSACPSFPVLATSTPIPTGLDHGRYKSKTTPLDMLFCLASQRQQQKTFSGFSFSFETLRTEGDYIPHHLPHVWILSFPSASSWLENSDGDIPFTTVCFGGLYAKQSFTRARASGAFLSAYMSTCKHKNHTDTYFSIRYCEFIITARNYRGHMA